MPVTCLRAVPATASKSSRNRVQPINFLTGWYGRFQGRLRLHNYLVFVNPFVRGVFVQGQCTLFAGHCPKVIETISGCRCDGMVTVRQQHGISVSNLMRDRLTVVGIDGLVAK